MGRSERSAVRLAVQSAPGLYQDVAIYDILHAPGTAREVSGLLRIARRFPGAQAGGGRTWLEPACGTGRYLVAAARRGMRCIGFDSSPAMVAYARRQLSEQTKRLPEGPRARVFCADMTDFVRHMGKSRLVRADFAFNPINTIRHLESDAAMHRHFDEMVRVLKPCGIYAVGLSLTACGLESPSEDVWEGQRGGVRVKQVVQYVPPAKAGRGRARFEDVYSHLVIARGKNQEHRDSAYRLRCYSLRQWRALIDRSAMEVVGVVDEDGQNTKPSEPGYAIWVLRPRATR